jgi:uncharacterized RDD family membrane protein YckC
MADMTTPNPHGTPAQGSYPPPAYNAAAPGSFAAPRAGAAPADGFAPASAPAAPGVPAPLGRRAAAYAIDIGIVVAGVAVWMLIGYLLSGALGWVVTVVFAIVAWVLAIAWWFVYSAMQGGRGSVGMRVMKLRLVRLEGGAPLGFGAALLRNVIWGLAASIVVGYFSVFFDKTGRGQGWHDKVAQAFMRDARADAGTTAPARDASAAPPPVSPVAPAYAATPALATPSALATPAPAAPAASYAGPAPADAGRAPALPPLPPRPTPAAPAVPAPALASGDGLIAFVPGITQDPPSLAPEGAAAPASPTGAPPASPLPPGPAPVPPASPAPVPPPLSDDLEEDTILVRPAAEPDPGLEPDLEDTRLVSRTPPVMLEWDDGTRHTVTGRSLFGRNPAAPDDAELVVVRDETLSLSKTHFEILTTPEGAFVVDRHSTNGVTIARAGERIAVAPGERVELRAGDALEIGDRIVTFTGQP